HQSYYVNMFYIKEIGKNHVIMRNGVSIPISPYKYELVMEKYNLYLQEVN
ncbi:DNA-binding response regulator, partial [Coprobacillus sp. AM42-12AC]